MDFVTVVDQAIALLRQRGRLTYRTLQLQFQLDDAHLEALKDELVEGQRLAVDEAGRVLVWTGAPAAAALAETPVPAPLAYTPPYLAEKILTSRSALEGERKQVTVLFADIAGFTTLAEQLDPEVVHDLINRCFERITPEVHGFEGTINQYTGDGVMALFGAPIAHEDSPRRAVHAALGIQRAIRDVAHALQAECGLRLQMRVGLNTGLVVVGKIGDDLRMDYTAVGDTTNLAARLQQLAPPGSVVISAATHQHVAGFFETRDLGELQVKGHAPIGAFEVLRPRGRRTRFDVAVERGLTPLVGRERELATLWERFSEVKAGRGQVVGIAGEAGLGKSRLVLEFRRTLTQARDAVTWLEGHCISFGQASPFLPLIEQLRAHFQIDEGDDEPAIIAKVEQGMRHLGELEAHLPAIRALLSVDPGDPAFITMEGAARRRHLFAALRAVALRGTWRRPLVLVVEDLHWIDTSSEEFLTFLLDALAGVPLLLLVTYRIGYTPPFGSRSFATTLTLHSFSEAETLAMVGHVLSTAQCPVELQTVLRAKAEGVPLFIEEILKTLLDLGVLRWEEGAYRLVQSLREVSVPDTMQGIIMARLDRLSEDGKRTVQLAAVIGRQFPVRLLARVAGVSNRLEGLLRELQAVEMIYEQGLGPEPVYIFKHAVIQDVAYNSLLIQRRKSLHGVVGEAIEVLYQDRLAEHYAALAHHFTQGEVWEKALPYCRQAGATAVERSAFREAVTYFEQALVVLQHVPERRETLEQAIDLRLDLRNALASLAELERMYAYLREAETLAEALQDHYRLGRISAYLAHYAYIQGDQEEAIAWSQRTLALAVPLEEVSLQAGANFYLGQTYGALGDYHRALTCLRQNIVALDGALVWERFDLPYLPSVTSRSCLAWCAAELGAFAEGLARGEEGIRIAEAANHPASRILAYAGLGMLALRQGALQRAIPVLECGLALCQIAPFWTPRVAAALGSAYALGGRVTEALPLLEQAVQQATTVRVLAWQAMWSAGLSEAYLLASRLEIARQEHPLAVEPAATSYQQALALAAELGMRPLQAHCHRGLGTLYAATGQREQARGALSTAIALYRDMEMTFWPPETEAALVQVEGR